MNLDNNVVDCRLRLGPLHQLHPSSSPNLVCYNNRLHNTPPFLLIGKHPPNKVLLPFTIIFDLVFSMILLFKLS
jgi:hypothetical protein